MPDISYGDRTISYTVQHCPNSQAHYVSVSRDEGVVLKGPLLPEGQADKLVLKKARWILSRMELVRSAEIEDIVTGSRTPYLGKYFYTEVVINTLLDKVHIDFNQSRFRIQVNSTTGSQATIHQALDLFFRTKAHEKLTARVRQWSLKTGLSYQDLKFRQMSKRWGSCTNTNVLILNPDLIKLPYTLIDYVIVHELCHTKVKSHAKEFWAELSRHMPAWKELDDRLGRYKL